jgi:hypothetical protein
MKLKRRSIRLQNKKIIPKRKRKRRRWNLSQNRKKVKMKKWS